jgi:Uma2 family endonuclease
MTTLSTTLTQAGQKLLLHGIDWQTYQQLSQVLADTASVRLTYDRGALEIMTKSPEHERFKHLLSRLLETISDELGIDIAGFGEMTFLHPQTRGLEPDECYYIANVAQVAGRDSIDLQSDPAPDLVLEIDISSSSINRLALYAAFGVAEVWQYQGNALVFLHLQPGGQYLAQPTSLAFPWLAPGDLLGFFALRGQVNEREIVARFRTWVRQRPTP